MDTLDLRRSLVFLNCLDALNPRVSQGARVAGARCEHIPSALFPLTYLCT